MKRRILYVDDNPTNRKLIGRILQAEGYEMIEAADGESGWDRVLKDEPDFIFVDLLMPGLDGFELTRQIKSTPQLCHIPIVTLTAYGNTETEKIARDAGSDAFLRKPANVQQIQSVLHQFLGATF